MPRKLSEAQVQHLQALTAGPRGAYPGLNMGTLSSLERRGLVAASRGLGSMAMPHTAIRWRLTDAGRAAIGGASR